MALWDWLFGGEDDSAQQAQISQNADVMRQIQENAARARQDVLDIVPQADTARNLGLQEALNVLGATSPEQMRMQQEGNLAAQSALLAALPQMQNAILGNQVDMSGLRPTRIGYDPSMFRRQLPQFNQLDTTALQNRLTPTEQAKVDRDQAVTNFISGNFNGSPSGSANETDAAPGFGSPGNFDMKNMPGIVGTAPGFGSLGNFDMKNMPGIVGLVANMMDPGKFGIGGKWGPSPFNPSGFMGLTDQDIESMFSGQQIDYDPPYTDWSDPNGGSGDGVSGPSGGMNDPSEQGFGSGAY